VKRLFALIVAAALGRAVGLAQLRITSFKPTGQLTWTNHIYRAFYSVESAPSPAGPWRPFTTVADLDMARTNLITLQVPVTNAQAFYRVAWLGPDPMGLWDYKGFDPQGLLAVTGVVVISSMTVASSNAPMTYNLFGWRDLRYAGSETNAPWWLGPQPGTGYISGNLQLDALDCGLWWPTNCYDCSVGLFGLLTPNTYTGTWEYVTWVGPQVGAFTATRWATTNFVKGSH
jgi:hypothetical protein